LTGEDGLVDDALLPIGMFSRASALSIKTLRAYHEAGILVPARVDPSSGYRSYTADQLADAAVIQRLRGLDVPLARVAEVLERRDPEFTRAVLDEHRATMQARLDDMVRVVTELQSGTVDVTHTPVHVRDEPGRHTLAVSSRVSADELWDWLARAHDRLLDAARTLGASVVGAPAATYPPEIDEDDVEAVEAFVTITEPVLVRAVDGVRLGELPACRVAALVHVGDFDGILDTYRVLGAWVARNARQSGERVREHYLVGPRDADDPARHRTEIAWPVLAGS
jgi:DNA-binding transcriptional MerR regulator/effector-binding domain-containing protein